MPCGDTLYQLRDVARFQIASILAGLLGAMPLALFGEREAMTQLVEVGRHQLI